MSSCSVKHCKNYSGKKSSQTAISFFGFPKSPPEKRKWVEAIDRHKDWIPTKYSRVCSTHFEESSYDVTETGIKRLHKNAVPTKYLTIPMYTNFQLPKTQEPQDPLLSHLQEPGPARVRQMTIAIKRLRCKVQQQATKILRLQHSLSRCKRRAARSAAGNTNVKLEKPKRRRNVHNKPQRNDFNSSGTCRICLATNTKLYGMQEYSLQTLFEQLTGLHVTTAHRLPEHLCWECGHRLVSCHRLRNKALRSHGLMVDLLASDGCLTTRTIKRIDRQSNDLSSSLKLKRNEVNYELQLYDESPPKLNDNDICKRKENNCQEVDENFQEINLHFQEVNENFQEVNENFQEVNDNFQEVIDNFQVVNDNFREVNDNFQEVNDNFQEVHDNFQEVNDNFQEVNDNFQEVNDFHEELGNDIDMKADVELEIKKEETGSTNDADDDFLREDNSTSSNDVVLAKKQKKIKETKVKRRRMLRMKGTIIKVDRRCKPITQAVNTKLFTITYLTFDEQIAVWEKRQERYSYKTAKYRCTDCYRGFHSDESYKTHMIMHTNRNGTFECKICKLHWKSSHNLKGHAAVHVQRISCNLCPYVTSARHAANVHEKYHNGTKYQCPHCEESFTQLTTYMNHVRVKHPSDFVCALCGYSYVGDRGLLMHKKKKHRFDDQTIPEDGPYCDPCEVRFASREALDTHLKLSARHNSGEYIPKRRPKNTKKKKGKPKKKPEGTGIVLKWRKPLGLVKMTRADGPPVPCELCDMVLPGPKAYYYHFRREHPDRNRTSFPAMKNPCMCEVCGKLFQNMATLQDHSTTHSESIQFKCDQCDKNFRSKYRMVFHMRMHEEKRPTHPCVECGKHFSTHGNMQKHRLIHTGLKPFKCEMCGKGFKISNEKRQHIMYVHLKKPWPKRNRDKRTGERQNRQQTQSEPSNADIVQPVWPVNDP